MESRLGDIHSFELIPGNSREFQLNLSHHGVASKYWGREDHRWISLEGNILRLRSGALLYTPYVIWQRCLMQSGEECVSQHNPNKFGACRCATIAALRSTDGGRHWNYSGAVSPFGPLQSRRDVCSGAGENHVTLLKDGSILSAWRAGKGTGSQPPTGGAICSTRSTDEGELLTFSTWASPLV